MAHLIDKSAVVAEIERRIKFFTEESGNSNSDIVIALFGLKSFLDTLEVKEVDLKKLGEIARHLIAVKKHIEDMRLDYEEWSMLERIGYPERFKGQKGEDVEYIRADAFIEKTCEFIAENMQCGGYTLQTKAKFIKDFRNYMKR
jgi:hypothetical protein